MVKTDRMQQEPAAQVPGQNLLDGMGWRLPSGVALSHFALRSGFLSSRLWDDTGAWSSSAPAQRASRIPVGAGVSKESKQ